MTPDLIYDQLIGAGCAGRLTFSWGGNPGVGSLHRFRDAVENGWPCPLSLEERSHSDLANAYVAGAANLPFSVLRGYAGSDFPRVNTQIRTITCPFTGEVLAATPAVRPDVTVEERVRSLDAPPNACILPHWVVNTVCEVPRGATPSYAHGYYERDNVFYRAWDRISRDRQRFTAWIEQHILGTKHFEEYLALLSDPQVQAVYQ
jgi:glutaconate CoA-transferase subunit A